MGFFKADEQQIKEAMAGSIPEFNHGDVITFAIIECGEKEKDGSSYVSVKCKIQGGENDGKTYSHFFRDNPVSFKAWINLVKNWYTDDQIKNGFSPAGLVGKVFKSQAKLTAKGDKTYTNFYDFHKVSGVPTNNATSAGMPTIEPVNDIPF